MATYYVDDGGDGTTENSWATADTSINALDTEYALASDDIVYFGHDSVCQATNATSLTITGPTANAPVLFISATQGSSPPAYQASSTNQIDTTESSSYDINFDGSFALYGMCIAAGRNINFSHDADEQLSAQNCTFKIGANAALRVNNTSNAKTFIENCTISCAADSGASGNDVLSQQGVGHIRLNGATFVSGTNRTGAVISAETFGSWDVSGCDFTTFTNATACEIYKISSSWQTANISNCITAATWTPLTTAYPSGPSGYVMFTNVGPAYDPTYMYYRTYQGDMVSTSSIYRTGGAEISGTASAWLVTTRASVCSESYPFYSPWIYGQVGSTGSKTFDLYITNDTADFTDAQVWMEVEYLGTASEAVSTLRSDWRHAPDASSYITTTAANQADDTTSTWNGSGPSFTYKQKLSVTATVNVAGSFRARVAVGVANIASSRYFYIDPKVTVT